MTNYRARLRRKAALVNWQIIFSLSVRITRKRLVFHLCHIASHSPTKEFHFHPKTPRLRSDAPCHFDRFGNAQGNSRSDLFNEMQLSATFFSELMKTSSCLTPLGKLGYRLLNPFLESLIDVGTEISELS